MAAEDNLSHAEIWDDSALVNSWNAALEEYKIYHSIAAKGENVEKVLAEHQARNGKVSDEMNLDEVETIPSTKTHVPTSSQESFKDKNTGKRGATATLCEDNVPASEIHLSNQETDRKSPALPSHLIGQVHDDSLKNLLMSWYYAGYYTGLYEGQQQRQDGQKH